MVLLLELKRRSNLVLPLCKRLLRGTEFDVPLVALGICRVLVNGNGMMYGKCGDLECEEVQGKLGL